MYSLLVGFAREQESVLQHSSNGTQSRRRIKCQAQRVVIGILLLVCHWQIYEWGRKIHQAPEVVSEPRLRNDGANNGEEIAIALPSVRISQEEEKTIKRGIYGGSGDGSHLGGFTEIDIAGISPTVWKFIVQYFGVKSLLDVGCGRGFSTSWFVLHGVKTLCVEGSHDAVKRSVVPQSKEVVVEHDFSRGPWWPPTTVDAVWCVEFLEHVSRNNQYNYFRAFEKAGYLFVTHALAGGWHHVELHHDDWWRAQLESRGFVYSKDLTDLVRSQAKEEKHSQIPFPVSLGKNATYDGQHIWLHMLVFINPRVTALPHHAHLLAETGCIIKNKTGTFRETCGTGENVNAMKMPEAFQPLPLTAEMDNAWEQLIRDNVEQKSL